MGHLQNRLFFSGFLFLVIYVSSSNSMVRRFNYDAVLYEEFDTESRYVQFSRTGKDPWKDLKKLAESNKFQFHAMACTRGGGSWIAYPNENFILGEGSYYTLIMGESCFSTENIKSLQPLGEVQIPLEGGLIVFSKEHFQSPQKMVIKGSYSGDIGSFLYAGGKPWTFTSGSDSVCVMPTFRDTGETTLCLFPNMESTLNMKAGKITAKEGCEGDKTKMVTAQMCYSQGVHQIFPSIDFSYTKMKGLCGTGKAGNDTGNKFNLIMEIWKGRISHGIEEMENIKIPYEATFKQRVLWQFINVFEIGCPIVSPQYISLLRNVFLMHLRTLWTKQPELIGAEDDYWRHAYMFLTSCGDNIAQHPEMFTQFGHCEPETSIDKGMSGHDEEAYQELFNGEKFDTVIEQVWLMLNLVTPYCNYINDYKTNDWAEIVSLFRRHFLEPLGSQWMHPGPWQKLYPSMFHGFDIVKERQKMLTCIQGTLQQTPHFDPIGRTRFFLQAEKKKIEEYFVQSRPGRKKGSKETKGGKAQVVSDDDVAAETGDDAVAETLPGDDAAETLPGDDAVAETPSGDETAAETPSGDDSAVETQAGDEEAEGDAEAKGRRVKNGKSFKLPIISKRQ